MGILGGISGVVNWGRTRAPTKVPAGITEAVFELEGERVFAGNFRRALTLGRGAMGILVRAGSLCAGSAHSCHEKLAWRKKSGLSSVRETSPISPRILWRDILGLARLLFPAGHATAQSPRGRRTILFRPRRPSMNLDNI